MSENGVECLRIRVIGECLRIKGNVWEWCRMSENLNLRMSENWGGRSDDSFWGYQMRKSNKTSSSALTIIKILCYTRYNLIKTNINFCRFKLIMFYVLLFLDKKKNQEKSRHKQWLIRAFKMFTTSCCSPHKWVPKLATEISSSF